MRRKIKWLLLAYDTLVYICCAIFILFIYPGSGDNLITKEMIIYTVAAWFCLLIFRFIFNVYRQIWRYAGPGEYIRLMLADAIAAGVFILLRRALPATITFVRAVSLMTLNLLCCIGIRYVYQWIYQHRGFDRKIDKIMRFLLKVFTRVSFNDEKHTAEKIRVAIIGAGSIGVALADELYKNQNSPYVPVCFVDIDENKAGRNIGRIPVFLPNKDLENKLKKASVQEVVFAFPNISSERRLAQYNWYKNAGYNVKSYDYPVLGSEDNSKRTIHDFNIEDLLFRDVNNFLTDDVKDWYKDKIVLVTGGGGSIGSELARQIAKCSPKRLIILDDYENGAYDLQQELVLKYKDSLNLKVEIADICDKHHIEKIFKDHMPDIVLHAAAHKHVPLMERNVIEAVRNNVFGTLNVVETCEKYGVKRFIMISTDKAVNPTNVMGATKRMCEMIVQSRTDSNTSFSAVRFGNVLGSNGSVIPLFKKQLESGGPLTVTDKRIVRYFMTIPEASQLVMTSGAMAKNGELYVLDMGKPVRIWELAENMIRLSGLEPGKDIEIVETGLRPGEKLYEELLIKSETLSKTENKMIYIEKDKPLSEEEVTAKLEILKKAMRTNSNHIVKDALMEVIPTYHTPDEINSGVIKTDEMQAFTAMDN